MDSSLLNFPWLTTIIFLPLAGVFAVLLSDYRNARSSQVIGLVFSSLTLLLCLVVVNMFPGTGEMAFTEAHSWIPSLGAKYLLGMDGISLLMVFLTALLTVLSLIGSWDEFGERSGLFVMLMLSLETGVLGVFLALDLLLFYIFWEAMLIPMYFLIGIYGGPKRFYATTKFVLVTLFGSLLMLLAIAVLAIWHQKQFGAMSFALADLLKVTLPSDIGWYCCLAFLLAFAIKVPMWPVHTWLPDAHTEAPTAGSVMLAGVLLKMGTYGMLRFLIPLFPEVIFSIIPWLLGFSVIAIIYGSLTAMVQQDIKRLVACSSVSHMGFVTLGIFSLTPIGLMGGTVQMVNHGISTGALFLMAGMIHHRTHTRIIDELGGLAKAMPVFSTIFVFFCFSSIGLPGLNGFIGEFLILLGAFSVSKKFTAVAALGIVLGAVYLLWMVQRVIFGPLKGLGAAHGNDSHAAHDSHAPKNSHDDHSHESACVSNEHDLNFREFAALLPLIIGVLYIGIYPTPVIDLARPPVKKILSGYQERLKLDTESTKNKSTIQAPNNKVPQGGEEGTK
ncbi:MAG: NADH-quinone oxidoreductase subunit M [Candidatus Riflebacteria bacterium]|nr:NADH-quinone oxidoreductase subunit M [Candidatus Riflebacteria bacterium]